MERNPDFASKYSGVVEKYQTEGSSRQVPNEEVAGLKSLWYLPHHSVSHPRNLEEPRVVFNCASKTGATLLNDQLL